MVPSRHQNVARSKLHFYAYSARMKLKSLLRNRRALRFYASFYARHAWSAMRRSKETISVVSYPKSGRTWLERLLIEITQQLLPEPNPEASSLIELTDKAVDIPTLLFTHAGSSWESWLHDETEIARLEPSRYVSGRLVLLVRDPRDVQVSAYHHIRNRTGIRTVTPSEMVTSEMIGIGKLINFLNRWEAYCNELGDSGLMVRFEDLRCDPCGTLAQLCQFIGFDVTEEIIRTAVDKCSFERMQQGERENTGSNPWLTPGKVDDQDSYKVRKGVVGEHRAFFSETELEIVNSRVAKELNPALGYR